MKKLGLVILALCVSLTCEARVLKVYLAGPDVFRPNALEIGKQKQKIARDHGFEGLFPMDNKIEKADTPREFGLAIFKANVELMKKADFVVANITPFRGTSADPGTTFEMGYMLASGKPVFAYTESPDDLIKRVSTYFTALGLEVKADGKGCFRDPNGDSVENFNMHDNLMLEGAVSLGGSSIADSFEEALAIARKALVTETDR